MANDLVSSLSFIGGIANSRKKEAAPKSGLCKMSDYPVAYLRRRNSSSEATPKPANTKVEGSGIGFALRMIGPAGHPADELRGVGAKLPAVAEKTSVEPYQKPCPPEAAAKLPAVVSNNRIWKNAGPAGTPVNVTAAFNRIPGSKPACPAGANVACRVRLPADVPASNWAVNNPNTSFGAPI